MANMTAQMFSMALILLMWFGHARPLDFHFSRQFHTEGKKGAASGSVSLGGGMATYKGNIKPDVPDRTTFRGQFGVPNYMAAAHKAMRLARHPEEAYRMRNIFGTGGFANMYGGKQWTKQWTLGPNAGLECKLPSNAGKCNSKTVKTYDESDKKKCTRIEYEDCGNYHGHYTVTKCENHCSMVGGSSGTSEFKGSVTRSKSKTDAEDSETETHIKAVDEAVDKP